MKEWRKEGRNNDPFNHEYDDEENDFELWYSSVSSKLLVMSSKVRILYIYITLEKIWVVESEKKMQ